jgi:hypothetical protein
VAQARTGDPGRRDTPAAGRAGTPTGRLGSTVAGRYRLDEPRPGDLPGSERWTATDQILARRVTVTLVSGPRTAAVLDAARRAALVVDPRLARILDVGSADGTGYVVTEAVEGRSLATLASRAPLTADQARAVVGEAAAALEVARRRGVHHLALRPEAVVLTSGSRVVLEGLAVDGELLGASGGGAHAMSRTDTVGLVRVLYAALTGRWPTGSAGADVPVVPTFDEWSASGGSPARQRSDDGSPVEAVDPGLPAAPEHAGAPLPPADLVAGVPADLDTLCAVTLGPHDDGPHSPGELVRELEPWRAVRADEIFRAADAGRWPALPAQAGAPATAATGTTTAPPTGSSPMSDDQHGRTSVPGGRPADDSTPATGSPSAATAAGSAAAGGAAAGTSGAAVASVAGGAAGASAAGQAAAGAAAAGAAAGGVAASGKVARQSVRSAFTARPGAGARRPGTPPPAAPAPASFPPAASSTPQRPSALPPAAASTAVVPAAPTGATAQQTPAVPPARSGSPAEPAPAAPAAAPATREPAEGESLPPAIPPASRAPEAGSPTATPGAATEAVDAPAAAELAVAGITAADDERTSRSDPDPGSDPKLTPAVVPTPVRRASSAFGGASAAAAAPAPARGPVPAEPVGADAPEPLEQPAAGPASPAADVDAGGDGPSRPEWDLPFPSEGAAEPVSERRFDPTRWVLGLVALAVVIGVVVALTNVLSPFRSDDDTSAGAATQAPVATAAPAEEPAEGDGAAEAPAAVPPVIAGVNSIDPSDGDGEHEELVGRLIDGDPATTWYTHTYNRPDFAGFKDAVGLVITLQAPATVTSITLDVNGAGGNVEVRSTDAANPTAGDVLAAGALAPQTVLTLAQPTETQSIVLWFTSLSQTPDGQNRIEISNVAVS